MSTRGRRFTCDRCGAEVYRPDSGPGDDNICLNCWFGRVRGPTREDLAA